MVILFHVIRSNWKNPFPIMPPTSIVLAMGVWIAAVWLSGVNAPHINDYLFHATAMTYLAILSLFCAVLASQNDEIFFRAIWWFKLSIIIVAILGSIGIGILLLTGENDRLFFSYGKKLIVPFTRPNQLAGFLVLVLPLIWEQFRKPQKIWSQVGYGFIFAFLVIGLTVTSSRAGIIALIIATGIYVVWYLIRANIKLILAMLLSSAILTSLALYLGNFIPRVKRTIGAVVIVIREGQFTDVWRLENWSNALTIFGSNPIFGYGIGNVWLDFEYEVHNSYLSTLTETGVIGAASLSLLLILVLFLAIKNVWMAERNGHPNLIAISRGLMVGLFSFYVYATQHQVLRHRHLWIVIGLIIAAHLILENRMKSVPVDEVAQDS